MAACLRARGYGFNRKRVQRLMRLMGIVAIYQRSKHQQAVAGAQGVPLPAEGPGPMRGMWEPPVRLLQEAALLPVLPVPPRCHCVRAYLPLQALHADYLEAAVWGVVTRLLQEPETLREELRRQEESSPTREMAERELHATRKRLQGIPQEQYRLVEGYGKGLIPNDLMRARMGTLKTEQERLQARAAELERQLTRLEIAQEQESQALAFAQRVRDGLEHLGYEGRQQLLRLMVSAKAETVGETIATVMARVTGGVGMVAFKRQYLLAYLKGKQGIITLEAGGPSSPGLLRFGREPAVVMKPMFVQW